MQPSVQLDLQSGTISRRTSDSRTCHTAVSDSRWRPFYMVTGTTARCESPFNCTLFILLLIYLDEAAVTYKCKHAQSLTSATTCVTVHVFSPRFFVCFVIINTDDVIKCSGDVTYAVVQRCNTHAQAHTVASALAETTRARHAAGSVLSLCHHNHLSHLSRQVTCGFP